jgi:hypothetical protein
MIDELDDIEEATDDAQLTKRDAQNAYLFCGWEEFITQVLPEREAQVGISWDKWREPYCPSERGRYRG